MSDPSHRELPRQTNYETARALARERLKEMDLEERCRCAGFEVTAEGSRVRFLEREYFLRRSDLSFAPGESGASPEIWEEIVLLHYLIGASGGDESGELISWKEIPEGASYYPVFVRRTSGILLSAFAGRLQELMSAAKRLGAEPVAGMGDFAFRLRVLPRFSLFFVCHLPDEEFPAEIQILFDRTEASLLPAEDIAVLTQMTCLRLVKAA